MPRSLVVVLVAIGAFSMGCQRNAERHAAEPLATTTSPTPPAPAPRPAGEMLLDLGKTAGPAHAPPPVETVNPNLKPHVAKVRTPSDEYRPGWVPVAGRLTVVGSADLATNLGLPPVPPESPQARMTVAERLAEENARRKLEGGTEATRSWNIRNGRVSRGRYN